MISWKQLLCYPCAMAPTINATKLVAIAIATFVSTDKFIISPASIMAETPVASVFYGFEFPRAYGCHAQREVKLVISDW